MATLSDTIRHDQLIEVYGQFKRLLTKFGYELRADDWEGDVDLDIHTQSGDHLFTIDTIERAL